jgi:hypothetical protein
MSLKIFHMVFIVLSIATSVFVGIWGLMHRQIGFASIFLLLAAVLVVYGFRAFRKLREIP